MVKFRYGKALSIFKRWLNGGLLPMGLVDVETDYIEGESVARRKKA